MSGTVAPAGRETGFEAELPPGVHRLVPFSVGGAGIVVGKPATVAVTDPVRHLTVTPFADYATVSWQWPANAQIAEVSWRVDGEEDVRQVDQGQYRSTGGFRIPLGKGPCHIEVRAVIAVAGENVHVAAGVGGDHQHRGDADPLSRVEHRAVDRPARRAEEESGVHRRAALFRGPGGDGRPSGAGDAHQCGRWRADPRRPATPRSGTLEEFKATVPSSIKKPFWVRCFVVAGQARLIDPPITSLKET